MKTEFKALIFVLCSYNVIVFIHYYENITNLHDSIFLHILGSVIILWFHFIKKSYDGEDIQDNCDK